jgi:YgiT-type zinc finger domain-containing protein
MTPGLKTSMLERGQTLLVVRDVPAQICGECGESTFDADTADRLINLLGAAVEAKIINAVQTFHPRPDHEESPRVFTQGEFVKHG